MKLDLLHTLNAERAARRAVVVVTDTESGTQRLVKAADVAKDPLADVLDKRLRMAKSGMEETTQGRVFLTVHVPSPQLVITGAVHISQTLAPLGQMLDYDVTIVDQTHGAFAYVLPQTPAEEAELTRQWIEGYQIPHATIAVEVTPFWKLPSPDGRRIERPSPNFTAYGFGKSWTPQRSEARYLIDQDGIIVDVLFNYQAEPQIIEALLERQRQGGAHATK